jgi:phosphoglucosamine mutase
MKKNNFNLGGEQSGHIILGKFATTGDGLLVALEVLFAIRKGKKPVLSLTSLKKLLKF